jgi:UDP-glucuronate 4-epimerase
LKSRCLITGVAGFIGMHIAIQLLSEGYNLVGIDNLNDYYDVNLKIARLRNIKNLYNFEFHAIDISDYQSLESIVKNQKFDFIIHLAAQAGVRYSITNPHVYGQSNLIGFLNILEISKNIGIKHFIFASSSSVYGGNKKIPFSESDPVDYPISLYAATKRSNELMAHSYSHLFKIPMTGLRFFTVYGSWGRPDMAPFLFTKAIIEKKPIQVFNYGNMKRDFTFIGDIKSKISAIIESIPNLSQINFKDFSSNSLYRLLNVGSRQPIGLKEFIETLELILGKKAILELKEIQPGDVEITYADIDRLENEIGTLPVTSLLNGLIEFTTWYKGYFKVS